MLYYLNNALFIGGWIGILGLCIAGLAAFARACGMDLGEPLIGKKGIIILLALSLVGCGGSFYLNSQTASFKREVRTRESNWNGGIERTVTVYSQTGEKIDEWHGKFDVDCNGKSNEVMFDSEDGRVIIEGGIVVISEN